MKQNKFWRSLVCFLVILATIMTVPLYVGAETDSKDEVAEIAEKNESKVQEQNVIEIDNPDSSKILAPEDAVTLESEVDLDPFLDDYCEENKESVSGEYTTNGAKTTFPDEAMTISLKALKNNSVGTVSFKQILSRSSLAINSDLDNYYFGIQGSCYDGTYYYFSYLVKNDDKVQVDARILCAKMNADGSFQKIALHTGLMNGLYHINDMTYNPDTGKIVLTCCQMGYHHKICMISATELRSGSVSVDDFDVQYLGCMATSIDYNKTRSQYIVGVTDAKNYFAILDSDFNIIKCIGDSTEYTSEESWSRQGIFCDNKYIYALYFNDTKVTSYERDSRIRIFNWNGDYIKTLDLVVDNGTDYMYEAESMVIINDHVYLVFNCLRSKSDRSFQYVDISDKYSFHIQYCPDENVENYIGKTNNGNVSQVIIRGIGTELYKYRTEKSGKKFVGWTAYREEIDSWYYESADGTTRKWSTEADKLDGYTKYVYSDKQTVSQTGASGNHVLMCAQWVNTSNYYIKFLPNGGSGTMPDMTAVYGVSMPLSANKYTKTNRVFQGWNAYWSERNKWYYVSEDGNTKAWYKEGSEPDGYKKYVYSDGQNVAKTAIAGGHIYMYALWDEYYIQYRSGFITAAGIPLVAIIAHDGIKTQHTAKYKSGNTNVIKVYKYEDLYQDDYLSQSGTLRGYYLYRLEVDKWYYQSADGSTKNWYEEGKQPSGYVKYVKPIASSGSTYLGGTARPGEHLILYALWQ